MRRELIINGFLKSSDELQFSSIVITFKPKCAATFDYRRWIFLNIIKGKLECLVTTIWRLWDINNILIDNKHKEYRQAKH